jgi:choline dehydrogenase-like flavoprotein
MIRYPLPVTEPEAPKAAPPATRGAVISGREVTADVEEKVDVCVVGSGAGGGVVAARLAAKGVRVVVLEEGGHFTNRDFKMQESLAYPQLYQEQGNRATSDLAIHILQGRAVGGSTVVNWTASFRTPEPVLAHWRKVHGAELTVEVLDPHWAAVEERLHIQPQPAEGINFNNGVLWRGAEKLKMERAVLRRNVKSCINSGYCGMGCPINAKQSILVTYVPDAVEKGARIYANARAVRVETQGRRAGAVVAEVLDPATDRPTGKQVVVRPKVVVLAGGAINTPALLLRSGIDPNGRVGKRTFLHPVIASAALFEERVEGFYGAPQSVSSHHFADRGEGKVGYFMEAVPIHPMLTAVATGGLGGGHQDLMAQLGHVNGLIALTIDGFLPGEEGGTVSLRSDGRIKVDYPIRPEIWEALRHAAKTLARVQLAAGAREVRSLHAEPVVMKSTRDVALLDQAPWAPLRVSLFTAHQMGGAAFGRDPSTSVVSPKLKHHHLDNLYVVDGSVLPTSLGVNPQLTIYGLAHWAAEGIVI